MMSSPREKTPLWPDLRRPTEIGEKLLASTPFYGIGRVAREVARARATRPDPRRRPAGLDFRRFSKSLSNIRCECPDRELERIPEKGPVVVVSNHPFGLAEGPRWCRCFHGAAAIFGFLRTPCRLISRRCANWRDPGHPFGGERDAARAQRPACEPPSNGSTKAGSDRFSGGRSLLLPVHRVRVADPAWSETIGRIARIHRATVVPVMTFMAPIPPRFKSPE